MMRPLTALAAAMALSTPAIARAQKAPDAPVKPDAPERQPATSKTVPSHDGVPQQPLLGNWAPRKWLAQRGVTLTGHFIAEVAANTRGYKGTGADYAQHIDLGAIFDLKKMGIASAGTVRVVFSDRVGRALHEDRTGGFIQYQAFYGQGRNARFDELSYETPLFDKRLSFKGGFYAMGNDFAGLPYVCNFNNNGNCGHPLGLLYGSGWIDNPTGQWGSRLKWTDRSGWYVQSGIYDVTPPRKTRGHGFDLGFDGNTGFIAPVEIGYVRPSSDRYAGTYKLGVYYDSSRVAELGAPGVRVKGRVGLYVEAAQQIWKPDPDGHRGIALFGIATVNDARTGFFRVGYEAGSSWRGAISARPDDILSVSWVREDVNSRVTDGQRRAGQAVQTDEQLVELNYGIQATPSLIVRPSLQYVLKPGGYETRPDSLIVGLHLGLTL